MCCDCLKWNGAHIFFGPETNQTYVSFQENGNPDQRRTQSKLTQYSVAPLSEFRFQTDPTLHGIEHWSSGNTGRVCRVFPERNKVIQLFPVGGGAAGNVAVVNFTTPTTTTKSFLTGGGPLFEQPNQPILCAADGWASKHRMGTRCPIQTDPTLCGTEHWPSRLGEGVKMAAHRFAPNPFAQK